MPLAEQKITNLHSSARYWPCCCVESIPTMNMQPLLDLLAKIFNSVYVRYVFDLVLIDLIHNAQLLSRLSLCRLVASKSTRRCRRASSSQHSCRCDRISFCCHTGLWWHIYNSGIHAEYVKFLSVHKFLRSIYSPTTQKCDSEKICLYSIHEHGLAHGGISYDPYWAWMSRFILSWSS